MVLVILFVVLVAPKAPLVVLEVVLQLLLLQLLLLQLLLLQLRVLSKLPSPPCFFLFFFSSTVSGSFQGCIWVVLSWDNYKDFAMLELQMA